MERSPRVRRSCTQNVVLDNTRLYQVRASLHRRQRASGVRDAARWEERRTRDKAEDQMPDTTPISGRVLCSYDKGTTLSLNIRIFCSLIISQNARYI